MKKWKRCVAAAVAALSLATPIAAEAHFLSSAQEKEIGTRAAQDFANQIPVHEDMVLTHIQDRLMEYNSDKLWMYGTPGKKRGLERVLRAQHPETNAISYGGGQIFVYDGMFDLLSAKELGWKPTRIEDQNTWKTSNLYQMSAMAATVGHEIGHWENEDMLRKHDKQMYTKIIASVIPVGNIWAALGLAAGTNLINQFNSRQMGFRTEQQADEKAMEYAMEVPEYSIGGEAILQYRVLAYKQANLIEDAVTNWSNPHSKTGKRLERALKEQERQSKGFIKWNDLAVMENGIQLSHYALTVPQNSSLNAKERQFFVYGQIATSIYYDICKERNIVVASASDVFPGEGSMNDSVLILKGHGNDGRDHAKIVDIYHKVPVKTLQTYMAMPIDKLGAEYDALPNDSEAYNFVSMLYTIRNYEKHRAEYIHRNVETPEISQDDN